MHLRRNRLLAAGALLVALPAVAGCSSATTSATTTTTTAGGSTTTTTGVPPSTATSTTTGSSATSSSVPVATGRAVGTSGGITLSVTSTPRTGALGHTTIAVVAVLTGPVVPARLDFLVSDSPSSDQGQPATDQPVSVTGPGTFTMPTPFSPPTAGSWAAGVVYSPNGTSSTISLSGLPPHVGAPVPFPQLVTVVTG